MKKIAIVLHDMRCGGVEKSLTSLLKELDYGEYSVDLFLFREEGDFLQDIPEEVNVIPYPLDQYTYFRCFTPGKKGILQLLRGRKYGTALYCGVKLLLESLFYRDRRWQYVYKVFRNKNKTIPGQYDIAIDYQGMGSAIMPTAVVHDKIQARRKLTWIHTDMLEIPEPMLALSELVGDFDQIVCVSEAAKKTFISRFPTYECKATVFYNIIPEEQIRMLSMQDVGLCRNEKINILSVGRLAVHKGYDIALKAMLSLKNSGIGFCYYIVGDGEQRAQLTSLVKEYQLEEYVIFAGKQQNPYPYYRFCDIYLQPSMFEGYCITLAEARLFHMPIITTDFAGAREQIVPDYSGIIVQCNSAEIAKQLKTLCADEGKRVALTEALKQLEIKNNSRQSITQLFG